ncbi:MAG: SUMF1/EgtB/PvdO family nonheme iron enzyme [Candidatus Marinimicrobia bacterium]|nr:SUMF1/EgtB/PvdO family nonheme iron enzyme [Candidatus Neomarinimicrobiota bacterium]
MKIKKTELPQPDNLKIIQISAFSLLVNWSIPAESAELVTQFSIETFAIDSLISITNDEFTSYMQSSQNSRQLMMDKDEVFFDMTVSEDTLLFSFTDSNSVFNSRNYYRITVYSGEIYSYSYFSESGFAFRIASPVGFTISQTSDFELNASWNRVPFAAEYELIRYVDSGDVDTSFTLSDTFYMDRSFNPKLIFEGSAISNSVDGLQPNKIYSYSVLAIAENDGERRFSYGESSLANIALNIKKPQIRKTRPKNSETTRIYIQSATLDENLDSLFVFRFDSSLQNWISIDTGITASMGSLADMDELAYHILDVPNRGEATFIVQAKGKVNSVFSNDTTGNVFPLHNYERIEAGFNNSLIWINSFYLSTIEYSKSVAFLDKSVINPIVDQDSIFPTDSINWVRAVLICDEFANNSGLTARLPSEVEWEYAALKEISSSNLAWDYHYPWGSNEISGEYANYINSGDSWDNHKTPVAHYDGKNGTFDNSSAFGIFDLAGNVLEWCGSGNQIDDISTIDIADSSIIGEPTRALRGGGYWHDPTLLKSDLSNEFEYHGELAVPGFGFRILIEESESDE